jgi:hypothetical protein
MTKQADSWWKRSLNVLKQNHCLLNVFPLYLAQDDDGCTFFICTVFYAKQANTMA